VNHQIRNILILGGILALVIWILAGIFWAFMFVLGWYLFWVLIRFGTAKIVSHLDNGEALKVALLWFLNK
jgi:hypothetical protein